MSLEQGSEKDLVSSWLNDIRLVTQLANATAADFRQKNAQTFSLSVYAEVEP